MNGAKKRFDAFAGEHITPDGRRGFYVFYMDKAAVQTVRAAQRRPWPPGHPNFVKTGWRWCKLHELMRNDNGSPKGKGPFSCSRSAYKDAVMHLQIGAAS